MSSSALTGERRWASARRGGMTVLGKVAAPKPLNLPSQRLENHGLDPNVEIVPKGTLSWGSRPSSSGSNAWVSSSSSPNAGGGTTSPSHLSGRPSSGGSGTRPSTAGSDRTHEAVSNAWGPNSRPSSASGKSLTTQTSSAPLRPRSADNRPNSSQLSRFAEPVSESSVPWGPSNTAERSGIKSSKEDGFSLSTGDFPTLGSEKDHSVKTIESGDHARPSSASGSISQAKEDTKSQADVKHGTVNTWRTEGPRSAEDGIHPNMEKWQGEPQQYYNANIPPQHFDAWRGSPPINAQAGVWYRGRPPGPPFAAPLGPGGFQMEPFPYYRPQIPPPPLAGSQPVPPSVGGPRGPHPKNGDLFRPQMPDAFARPGMTFRPGFYPGPRGPPGPMSFEGYYGPPMGYCNNERDVPYMGMTGPPHGYNGYPGPGAPDIGNSHGRVGGRGPSGKTLPEQAEGDHFEDKQGPRRFPLRNHDEWDRKEGESREHDLQPNFPNPGKGSIHMIAQRKNEWGAEEDIDEDMYSKRRPSERSYRSSEYRDHSADSLKVKSFEGMGKLKAVNDNWANKAENVSSAPPELSQLPFASARNSSLPAATKDPALMQKIEGLNAKIRVSDGRNDGPSGFNMEEQMNSSQHEVIVQVGDKPIQPMATIMSRRSHHDGRDRVDHRGKGKFNSQDSDGWRKKPLTPESPTVVAASKIEPASIIQRQGPSLVDQAAENSMINPSGKNEGDSAETYDDTTDIHAQRARMRELAKQRALQLQKEEEERTREQKAKALAKLEELNRRTLSGEVANQKEEEIEVIAEISGEQESRTLDESVMVDPKFQEPRLDIVSNDPVDAVDRESIEVTGNSPLEVQQTGLLESDASHSHHLPTHENAHNVNAKKVTSSQLNDGGNSRHKRMGYKQKQNNSSQKSLIEKSVSNVVPEVDHILVGTIAINPSEVLSSEIKPSGQHTSITVVEQSAHQKRKSNRNSKNKHKADENLTDLNLGKDSVEAGDVKGTLPSLDSSVLTVIDPDRAVQAQDGWSSLPNEESQSRVNNQLKPQPSRRMPRNQQPNRFVDKLHGGDSVKWAPVGTQNKVKGSDEASQKSIQESANNSTKGDNMAHNSSKGKRAEMERYVPKPVAKELAQQGSVSPSSSLSRSDEDPVRQQSFNPASGATNEGDGKHKKEHGTWRQRGSTDSSQTKGANPEPSSISEPTKPEIHIANAETKASGLINASDGYNNSNNTATATFSKYPAMRDQGSTGRGKRYQPRVPRSTGNNNHDPENISSGEMDASYIQSDVNQTDRIIVSKENRSSGERTSSHWQPKSHSNAANIEHGNRASGSESVTTEINRLPKKDHRQHKVQVPPQHDKESTNIDLPHRGHSVKSNVTEESILGHPQDANREKKPAPVKGRPYSPHQDPIGPSEQSERNNSSGSRRNWSQNSRPVKSHESRGDWSSGAFRERPRQNMHYEYQPVGPYKASKPEKPEEPADNVGTRYKESGQSHHKHGGNFNRRQGGAIRVESGQQE